MDRLDEIIKRLARIEKHLGIPDEPPPPKLLRVIQYHQLHVELSTSVYAASLCGFDDRDDTSGANVWNDDRDDVWDDDRDELSNRLWISDCQDIIDGRNSHVLCPQCCRIFQEKYSREVVRGLYHSLKGVGTHRERVLRVIDLMGLPADRETYDSAMSFWRSCLTLKYWKPEEKVRIEE